MTPAQQRFGARASPGPDVDAGLVDEAQLVRRNERLADADEQFEATVMLLILCRRMNLDLDLGLPRIERGAEGLA